MDKIMCNGKIVGFSDEYGEVTWINNSSVQSKEKKKIIRKFEDFDGMKNGKGLRLKWSIYTCEDGSTDFINVFANNQCFYSVPFSDVDDEFFKTLKAMGFEFEWKPKRTLEEVLADYTEKPFEFGKDNYYICKSDRGKYKVGFSEFIEFIGAKYYSITDTAKICEELNS